MELDFTDIVTSLDPKCIQMQKDQHIKSEGSTHFSVNCSIDDSCNHKKKLFKSITNTQPNSNSNSSDHFNKTDELLHKMQKKQKKRPKMEDLLLKKDKDPFGVNVNEQPTIVQCPWCFEKKGYRVFTKHLHLKCAARSHLSNSRQTRSTRPRSICNTNTIITDDDDDDDDYIMPTKKDRRNRKR